MSAKSPSTILHIIDSFGLGGAEKMVLGTINNLKEYNHVLVLLHKPDDLVKDIIPKMVSVHILNYSRASFISTVIKLRKIIEENSVQIVHAHLFWLTIVARTATPRNVKFIFSLHSIISEDMYKNKWYSGYTKMLDKITYRKRQILIGVSSEVVSDYKRQININGKSFVLHNFVDEPFFLSRVNNSDFSNGVKLVAVGNLKEAKNYSYLIDAFKQLKEYKVKLDIYGEGHLYEPLQKEIDKYKLNITLKGKSKEVHKILPDYHAYVMCSLHEGFGLAPAEAMVVGLAPILSDIPALREMSFNKGIYIDISSTKSFVDVVTNILNGSIILTEQAVELSELARSNYSCENYLQKLVAIYES